MLPGGRRFRAVDVSTIEPNRYQPRRAFDASALDALAESIKTAGVIQPIAVRPAQGDSGKAWELIAGERRWRAAKRAGLERIPALIVDLSEREAAEWALVENLQREDLDPMERADALKGLADEFGLTHAQIGEQIGLDRATVSNFIRLTELEPEVRMLVSAREGERLTGGHARALRAVPAGDERVSLARHAAREGWSVRALEKAIAEKRNGSGNDSHQSQANKTPAREPESRDSALSPHADIERQLSEHFSTRVRIESNGDGEKGRLVVDWYSLDQFDELMRAMGVRLSS